MRATRKHILVAKHLVHKVREENVHISGLRRSLPVQIPAEFFAPPLAERLSEADLSIFRKHYQSDPENAAAPWSRFSLPKRINGEEVIAFYKRPEGRQNFRLLKNFYRRERKTNQYRLTNVPNEIEEEQIQKALGFKAGPTRAERLHMGGLLETLDSAHLNDVFYADLHIDTEHDYFFEHPQDHVPGMMLIEACRQMNEACCHAFGGVPFSGVAFVLNSIQVQFQNYVELHLPVKIMTTATEAEKGPEGYWQAPILRSTMFQIGRPVMTMTVCVNIISEKAFRRIRLRWPEHFAAQGKERGRFLLRPGIQGILKLTDDLGQGHTCHLIDISLDGFQARAENGHFSGDIAEFSVSAGLVGPVSGRAKLRWTQTSSAGQIIGFEILDISRDNRHELLKLIGLCTVLQEERTR